MDGGAFNAVRARSDRGSEQPGAGFPVDMDRASRVGIHALPVSVLVPATNRNLTGRATWGEYLREDGSVRPAPEGEGTELQAAGCRPAEVSPGGRADVRDPCAV